MKNNYKKLLLWAVKVLLITGTALMFVCPFSCRATEEGIVLIKDNTPGPAIENFYVTSKSTVRVVFNKEISVKEASVTPKVNIAEISVNRENSENLWFADFIFGNELAVGECFSLYGEVADKVGNTLTFSIPFKGYNSNIPEILITEIHPMYGSSTSKTSGTVYKCEYVEFYAKTGGNLSGLELYSASDGKEKKYSFPAIEVSEGEIITVHLRKKEGMNAVNETGSVINLSSTYYSSSEARDLWEENESARLGDYSDVIYISDSQTGNILDGVCYCSSENTEWKNEELKNACEKVSGAGVWPFADIQDALCSDGLTLSKSLERISYGVGKECWKVTDKSGTNPGKICF